MDFSPDAAKSKTKKRNVLGVALSLVHTRENVFGQRDIYGCVQVLKVFPLSAATRSGIVSGDVIVEIDGIRIPDLPGAGKNTVAAVSNYLESLQEVEILKIVIVRDKREQELNIML